MGKPLMDIIVTHHDEPWEVGKKLFEMLGNQRNVDFGSFAVTIVQSGGGNILPWKDLLKGAPFKIRVVTISDRGVAYARNVGMENSFADWIMFFDFDDMFSDVCSLKMIVELLPTDDYDVLWGKYYSEEMYNHQHVYINKVEGNFISTCCKLYRRKFLEEHHIRFDSRTEYHSDYLFNALILAETPAFRVGTINSPFFTFMKTFRTDSMTRKGDAPVWILNSIFDRNVLLADAFRRRGREHQYCAQVVRTLYDEYYTPVKVSEAGKATQDLNRVAEFFRKHEDAYNAVASYELEVIKDDSESGMMNIIQYQYNTFGEEYIFANERTSLNDWIEKVRRLAHAETVPVQEVKREAVPEVTEITETVQDSTEDSVPERLHWMREADGPVYAEQEPAVKAAEIAHDDEPRVAVFCGTYNTYINMVASAKSLLCHTKMDKIYFLTEDDQFPYELPDIIECINIKNHPLMKVFDENGPNFVNSWTYMCLTRAIFPRLFPQYRKVLSLDVDIVVEDDISELWDIDMSDLYIAGVEEPQRRKSTDSPLYINFGVTMMNLEKLRADRIDDEIIAALNKNKFGCPEQDAFNKFCAGHIGRLENDYNVTVFSHITGEPQKEKILHYAGIKYWRHFAPVRRYSDLPWDDVLRKQGELS